MERVLVTGIAGGLGQLVARRLLGQATVVGVDRTAWDGHPREIDVHVMDLRKRKFEDLIRRLRPDAIVHLAFVRHFRLEPEVRHQINVAGTKQLLEYAAQYGVKQLVVFSSSYVYGALPENSYYLDEDAPLNVSRTYPDIRDLAEVDSLAGAFLWKYPEIATTILRPVNVLGYYIRSAISQYLKLEYVPTILGFNPMLQFIHEEDVAEAIALALERDVRGAFNLVGPGAVPLHVAVREIGSIPVPLPEPAVRAMIRGLFQFGLFPFPPGAVDFAKYQCTIDGSRFQQATGFRPLFGLEEIFASVCH